MNIESIIYFCKIYNFNLNESIKVNFESKLSQRKARALISRENFHEESCE